MSAKDVATIRNFFNEKLRQMTAQGTRTDPGWWNNLQSSSFRISGGTLGHDYSGCGDQADEMEQAFHDLHGGFDDSWTFTERSRIFPSPHHWLEGTSDNPSDPKVTLDPYNGTFEPDESSDPDAPQPVSTPTPNTDESSSDAGLEPPVSDEERKRREEERLHIFDGTKCWCGFEGPRGDSDKDHRMHDFTGALCWCGARGVHGGQPR
jgi:hypothetical protein